MGLLELKKSKSHWIEVDRDSLDKPIKFLVDYPKKDKALELEEMHADAYGLKTIKLKTLSDDNGINPEVDLIKVMAYKRQVIKYSVKDFTPINIEDTDDDGNITTEILRCKVVNDEMDEDVWWKLVENQIITNYLFSKIIEEIQFNNSDKKKLNTVISSLETETSEVN